MRILITGGAGFIGSHLCEKLCKSHEVVCLDNLSSGNIDNIKSQKIEFVEHDITKPFDIRCDLIFNMASPASPVDYQNNPIETLATNSIGMKNVLDNATKYNARVLQASSSEVYGDPVAHPQNESYWGNVNPIGLRSCYDEGKRFAEALCMAYARKKSANIIIARIFNTYGPKMRVNDGRVVPNFIHQAISNQPITIYGTGKQTRSFCYIYDMVDGLCLLAFSKIRAEIFNIGNPKEYSIAELAEMIKKKTSSKSKIIYKKSLPDDPSKRRPDITRIKSTLGWKPKTDIEEGLSKTIEWFRGII